MNHLLRPYHRPPRQRHHRVTHRARALLTVLALAGTAAVPLAGGAPQAAALTPPVGFTADDLPTWQTNGIVWALASTGSTVFVGGTFSQVRPPNGEDGAVQDAVNFTAMDAATGRPTSCRLSFTVGSGTATVRALAVSPDQKTLYAGGYFGRVNGTQVSSLAAIDIASCTPKAGFHAAFPATVRALAVTDDTVYAGGDFTSVGGEPRERFAAVDAGTGAVRAFRADADEPGRAVAVSHDGRSVALGGDFFSVNGADSHALAVVDATTGRNVQTYPRGFIDRTSVVKSIAADADGFYTGNEGTGGGVFDGRIALDAGTFDQRWRDTCLGATQSVLPDHGVLYSASHAHDCSSMDEFPDGRRHHLMAQRTADPALLSWFPDTNDGLGESIGPRALTTAVSGSTRYLWAGGEFTTVNGAPAQGLTRFASGPDTGAPSIPQASAESTDPGEVQVSWRSSLDLDDSWLTYRVYRDGSTTPLYTVSGDSFEWERPELSYTDTDVTPGQTYRYQVSATDAAGNTSTLSAAARVTVPQAGPGETAQTVTAAADTYVNAGAPGSSYGTSSSLAVRGDPEYTSYLRFDLPDAPAGTVLKGARLTVRTSTGTGAGSADTVSVVPVDGDWAETGDTAVTYRSRPAVGSGVLGTFAGPSDGSAAYTADLDTDAVAEALGGSFGVALTGDGGDALWLWSHEAAAALGTPQLVLRFGAP